MKTYHITGNTKYFKDAKTYYNVPAAKVAAGVLYMSKTFQIENLFIYEKIKGVTIGNNPYICCYSAKFDNYRTKDGILHKTYNFS